MNILIQLFINEILAISFKVSNYLHDKTRKQYISIDISSIPMIVNIKNISFSILNNNVNLSHLKKFYTCLFEWARITLNHAFDINSLLNNNSKLNMIFQRIFEYLKLSIDIKIHWRIDKYDSKMNIELNEHDSIDVYYKISINIDNINIKQSIFIMKYCNNDFIFEYLWEWLIRIEFINKNDDFYIIRIKSLNESKIMQFYIVKIKYEWNQEFVKYMIIEVSFLKV